MADTHPESTQASLAVQRFYLDQILNGHAEHVITAIDQLQTSLCAIQDHASNWLTQD